MSTKIRAVFFVEVNQDFGVGVRAENVTASFEAATQFLIVINFAVEDNVDGFVFVGQWLSAAFEIDDRQTAMDKTDAASSKSAFTVRSAMRNSIPHLRQQFCADRSIGIRVKDTGNATHNLTLLSSDEV
jgi:hypothetical protein